MNLDGLRRRVDNLDGPGQETHVVILSTELQHGTPEWWSAVRDAAKAQGAGPPFLIAPPVEPDVQKWLDRYAPKAVEEIGGDSSPADGLDAEDTEDEPWRVSKRGALKPRPKF